MICRMVEGSSPSFGGFLFAIFFSPCCCLSRTCASWLCYGSNSSTEFHRTRVVREFIHQVRGTCRPHRCGSAFGSRLSMPMSLGWSTTPLNHLYPQLALNNRPDAVNLSDCALHVHLGAAAGEGERWSQVYVYNSEYSSAFVS